MKRTTKRNLAIGIAIAIVVLVIVVVSLPSTRRLVGLRTIIVTDIEDNSTENPEPLFRVLIPHEKNSLGCSWEHVSHVHPDGPIIGEWRELRVGLSGTKTVRQEVHRSLFQASPAVARLSLPGESFAFALGSAPDGCKWRTIRIVGYYLDERTGPYPVKEHEVSGTRSFGVAVPEGLPHPSEGYAVSSWMSSEFTAKEGYEYLCIPIIMKEVLWERGRYKIQKGKDAPAEPDLRRKDTLCTRLSYATFKRRVSGAPEPADADGAGSPPDADRPSHDSTVGSHRVKFDENGRARLEVFYDGKKVGTTARPIALRDIDPDAVLLAYRINNDGTVDFPRRR